MDQTWKVAFVVADGVVVAHIVSSELARHIRFSATRGQVFGLMIVLLGFVLTKVHRRMSTLTVGVIYSF